MLMYCLIGIPLIIFLTIAMCMITAPTDVELYGEELE